MGWVFNKNLAIICLHGHIQVDLVVCMQFYTPWWIQEREKHICCFWGFVSKGKKGPQAVSWPPAFYHPLFNLSDYNQLWGVLLSSVVKTWQQSQHLFFFTIAVLFILYVILLLWLRNLVKCDSWYQAVLLEVFIA